MNDEQRERARKLCQRVIETTRDLELDLHCMSDEVVAIEWEQVQADFDGLKRAMGVHKDA